MYYKCDAVHLLDYYDIGIYNTLNASLKKKQQGVIISLLC